MRTKRRRLGHGLRTLQMLMFGKAVDLHSFERRGDLRVEATALKVSVIETKESEDFKQ